MVKIHYSKHSFQEAFANPLKSTVYYFQGLVCVSSPSGVLICMDTHWCYCLAQLHISDSGNKPSYIPNPCLCSLLADLEIQI